MLKFFQSLLAGSDEADKPAVHAEPPAEIVVPGAASLAFTPILQVVNGFPVPDWEAVGKWMEGVPEQERSAACGACERAWLLHLRAALGSAYRVDEQGGALLLSSLAPHLARATMEFMAKTGGRIVRLLDGIAVSPEWGKDILIVLDDEEPYYRYVSRYGDESGEFGRSGGMYIQRGCGHFVTMKNDLPMIEPVIAHEMTHGCLSHLPIPAWLNEGLAVNTEQRLCPPQRGLYTAFEMHAKHQRFWGDEEIQQFWAGKSFSRPDNGQMLSYDLARILVEQFSQDWDSICPL